MDKERSDEEIETHYQELGYEEGENDYALTSMRHILVMAESDELGEYSDEAIAKARERVEEIYEEWLKSDMTEEHFAELANELTDDTGSNGGLYEDIYQGEMVEGIDTWLFDEERKPGDVAIIDNNGSYVGTHLLYFVKAGELYKTILSRNDLLETDLTEWFEGVMADYMPKEGNAFSKVGVF